MSLDKYVSNDVQINGLPKQSKIISNQRLRKPHERKVKIINRKWIINVTDSSFDYQ